MQGASQTVDEFSSAEKFIKRIIDDLKNSIKHNQNTNNNKAKHIMNAHDKLIISLFLLFIFILFFIVYTVVDKL